MVNIFVPVISWSPLPSRAPRRPLPKHLLEQLQQREPLPLLAQLQLPPWVPIRLVHLRQPQLRLPPPPPWEPIPLVLPPPLPRRLPVVLLALQHPALPIPLAPLLRLPNNRSL